MKNEIKLKLNIYNNLKEYDILKKYEERTTILAFKEISLDSMKEIKNRIENKKKNGESVPQISYGKKEPEEYICSDLEDKEYIGDLKYRTKQLLKNKKKLKK